MKCDHGQLTWIIYKRCSHCLFSSSIPAFAWKEWEKPQKTCHISVGAKIQKVLQLKSTHRQRKNKSWREIKRPKKLAKRNWDKKEEKASRKAHKVEEMTELKTEKETL